MPTSGKALLIAPTKATMAVGLLSTFAQVVVLTEEKTAVFPPHLEGNGRLFIHKSAPAAWKPAQFDLVSLPLGFTQPPAAEQLAWVRQQLKPDGVLYLGVTNRWSYRRWQGQQTSNESTWTLSQVQKSLQTAGFGQISTYGLVPNLAQPQTIFPLTVEATSLALARSWRKINSELAQTWATRWPFAQLLPQILPGYGLVVRNMK